jgi:hypothetical protein
VSGIGPLRLWSGLLIAPLAFATQVIASYATAADSCAVGRAPRVALVGVNVAALLLIGASLVLSLANARAVKGAGGIQLHEVGEGRTRFLVEFGLWMALLFAAATLIQLSAVFLLDICVGFAPSGL